MSHLFDLRPHQSAALAGLRQAVADGFRRVILQAPTGFGKTVVAAHIVAGARAKRKRIVFSVPSLGLVDQTFERFVANGIDAGDMGVIQASHPWRRPHAPVQIATAQTLARRELPETDIVVVDEVHIRHGVYDAWMDEHPDLLWIGLSATPWSRGLGRRWQHLVQSASLADLTAGGFLAPARVFVPSHPDLTGVHIEAGDYREDELSAAMNRPLLVADIVSTWQRLAGDRPTLCFCVDRNHARAVHERFTAAGIAAAYVDANTPREERDAIGRKLARGEVRVAVNIGTLTTGIDWDVRCVILARPTRSESLFVQMVGRGLRTAEGKLDCLVLDHSDTHMRLGTVYDIHHDRLCDGKPRKAKRGDGSEEERKQPLPRCCPSCAFLVAARVERCPSCGSAMPRGKSVDVVDGELREIGTAPAADSDLRKRPAREVYAELLALALERQRSSGWVAHTYRDIFGTWPRGMDGVAPLDASIGVRSFVRAKARAFAAARKREEAAHGAA